MKNVKIADQKVDLLRARLIETGQKPTIRLTIDEALGYLQSLERLAALERHLQNLTSDTYYKQG